jgi:hypothetical protein
VCCDLCSGCVTYCHLCLTGFKSLCVCAQVGCSVVDNRSLGDLFVDVCILFYLGFNPLSIIFLIFSILFVLETPDDG